MLRITFPPHWRRYVFFALALLLLGASSVVVGLTGPRFLGAGPDPTVCATPTMITTATVAATGTASPTATGTSEPTGELVPAWQTATATGTPRLSPTSTVTAGPTPCAGTPCASPQATAAAPCTATLTPTSTPQGLLHVLGTQIVDASGRAVVLRGAQIESGFNYIKQWKSGKKPTTILNSAVFAAMADQWKMDVLRVPLSNWIYDVDPTTYLRQLDQVVSQANATGLYVVLDLHDDAQSGSPYGKGADIPKTESVAFWKVIAAHFKSNPMVLFDVYNEPHSTSWQEWLRGGGMVGGATEVGFRDLVSAIRAQGAPQIIIVEPGSAGKGTGNGALAAEEGGWATFPAADELADPNIVYSLHVYSGIADAAAKQDAKWGPILGQHPLMYGEWSFLPNERLAECRGVAHDQADQVVNNFLNYMDARGASSIAWDFAPFHLIQDTTTFTPTTLDIPWTCGDIHSHAGMGTLVQQHLLAQAMGATPTVTVTPTS
jgi:endoglucanase